MIQATPDEQAHGELLIAGTIPSANFAAFLQTYALPSDIPTLMLLEEQPRHVITQSKRQDLLRFEFFEATTDFTCYGSGRVFHEEGELRWERQQENVQVIYTGHKKYAPQLQNAQLVLLDNYYPTLRAYFLFGKRLDEKQLKRIGPAAQAGDFAEVRIPRLLRYPQVAATENAERVQLVVCEYVEQITTLNFTYRFKELVSFQKQTEATGAK